MIIRRCGSGQGVAIIEFLSAEQRDLAVNPENRVQQMAEDDIVGGAESPLELDAALLALRLNHRS